MDIIGDVRRGWAALGDDVRRRIWVVMIISFVTQVAMLFYPADRIAYSFSSEEAYVASLDYLNGVVLPLLAFLIVAGIVLTAVQIFQLVKAYSSIKRAYLERAFPGVAVPDRVQWPLIPAIGLFIALLSSRASCRASSRSRWMPPRPTYRASRPTSSRLCSPSCWCPGCSGGSCSPPAGALPGRCHEPCWARARPPRGSAIGHARPMRGASIDARRGASMLTFVGEPFYRDEGYTGAGSPVQYVCSRLAGGIPAPWQA